MDIDTIYTSLVADKMSREKWGGCGCSSAWVTLAVMLYLAGFASYHVYGWAVDRFADSVEYEWGESWGVVLRIGIVFGIILFWLLLFFLLFLLARKK